MLCNRSFSAVRINPQHTVLLAVDIVVQPGDLPRAHRYDTVLQLALVDLPVAVKHRDGGGVDSFHRIEGGIEPAEVNGLPKFEINGIKEIGSAVATEAGAECLPRSLNDVCPKV